MFGKWCGQSLLRFVILDAEIVEFNPKPIILVDLKFYGYLVRHINFVLRVRTLIGVIVLSDG